VLEEEYETRRQLPQHLRRLPEPEPTFEYALRPAALEDLPSIREIYNHYVLNSSVTFDERALTLVDVRKKFTVATKLGLPFLVAESPRGQLLGVAWVLPWQGNAARWKTVEESIYLGPAATGKGLGKELLGRLLENARTTGVRVVVAVIADRGADASIRMHKNLGFKETGRMGRVGYKFDRWLGTVTLQKTLR
jgi:phosphinothricin acetyltransferase